MAHTILFFILMAATAIYGPRIYDAACHALKRRRGMKALKRINEKYRAARS